jgi:ribosome-associated translation inhibitor RaiA
MKIHVEAKNVPIEAALHEYVERVVRFTARPFEARACRVELDGVAASEGRESPVRCAIEVSCADLPWIRAEAEGATVSEAVHEACDRLERRTVAALMDFDGTEAERRAA